MDLFKKILRFIYMALFYIWVVLFILFLLIYLSLPIIGDQMLSALVLISAIHLFGFLGAITFPIILICLCVGVDMSIRKSKGTIKNISLDNKELYSISRFKLALLSVVTMGLYLIYWFYRNWKIIKPKYSNNIYPFWRAFFWPIFCHSLFVDMGKLIKSQLKVNYNPGVLASICLIGLLPLFIFNSAWPTFISLASLVYIQGLVNQYNQKINPKSVPSSRLNKFETILVITYVLIFIGLRFGFIYIQRFAYSLIY